MSGEPASRILTIPNAFTFLRVLLLPVILWLILAERYAWALSLLVAAGISDFLDGYLARLLKQRSLFGMYVDPIADKLLLSSSFLVLSMTEQIPWLVTSLVLARDAMIIVTVVVVVLFTELRRFPPSVMGKANTVVQLLAIYIVLADIALRGRALSFILHHARFVVMILVPALVIASGVQYAFMMLHKLVKER